MCRFARVLVSFGDKKYYTGIVITIHNDPPDFATKDITDILDTDPIVSPSQFELWQWIADYYICTLGEVMKAAIPAGLKLESETKLSVNTLFSDTDTLTPRQLDALNFIAEKKVCSLCELSKAMGGINPTAHVKALLDADAVYVSEQMRGTYRPKTEVAYALAHEYHSEDALLEVFNTLQSRAPRQLDALMLLIQQSGGMSQATSGKRVFRSALTSNPNVTATHLSELVKKGILMQDNVSISRIALPDAETCPPATLSEVQSQALSEILSSQNSCRPVLLQGVTGSGKTEIYIHLIQKTLAEGRNVLYLLPEIALTTQITNRLSKHFGPQMLVYHSKFSDSQRVEVYKMLLSSSSPYMLLGVRSSVLLPLANLGLIIVDEEHESSFKQYDPAPRYNARDMAVLLGSKQGALTILGSATPSLESFVNARDGRYAHVRLDQRHAGLQLPKVDVVDMKTARQHKEVDGIFSFRLRSAIAQALEANNQVILFQNRRGFSSYVECHQCAWVARCVNCDVALTYHKSSSQLVCHYCGHSVPLPITCPACGNPSLRPYGIGTEKIEEECLRLFPSARPVRMDLDTTRSRTAYEQIIADFAAHKHNILIGTQMVTKGLDFADVTLVGIINADGMLNMPDFVPTNVAFSSWHKSADVLGDVVSVAKSTFRRPIQLTPSSQVSSLPTTMPMPPDSSTNAHVSTSHPSIGSSTLL